jgi:cell shape-determining protein MreC
MKKNVLLFIIFVIIFSIVGYRYFIYPLPIKERIEILESESENFRRIINQYKNSSTVSEIRKFTGLDAFVFSSYPFSNRSVFVVSAGSDQGIRKGMPVTISGDVLLGQVDRVEKRYSFVKTIFDARWSSAVRVGENSVDGLLVGGSQPTIQFLEKGSASSSGDVVYSASVQFPHGLVLGTIGVAQIDPARSFEEALLIPEVSINSVKKVYVVTDFP